MTNTALGAGAEKAQKIIFISDANEKFYYELKRGTASRYIEVLWFQQTYQSQSISNFL